MNVEGWSLKVIGTRRITLEGIGSEECAGIVGHVSQLSARGANAV